MYKQYASPFVRVVQGIPFLWGPVTATTDLNYFPREAVWSPCNRLIAAAGGTQPVEVLDAVTLSRFGNFEHFSKDVDQQLGFSPDGHCLMMFAGGSLINWDLQTGGPLGTIFPDWKIPDMKPFSFTHSEDGKAVAVAYKTNYSAKGCPTYIYIYNLLSMTYIRYQHASSEQVIYPIWSHDGCYHYATISPVLGIRIWKSPFISEYPRTKEVKSLPIPNEIVDGSNFLFLPALSRLAFTLKDSIQIWDAKASKLLLKSKFTPTWLPDMRYPPRSSFSSDGHFFASASATREVYVWRESPTGYVFHQQLPFLTSPFPSPGPQLSPNGKSIIIAANSKIHQLQTRNHTLSLPSFSTQGTYQHHFILEFFPNEKFAAFVRWKGNMVTILDLQSGEQRWC